MSTPNIGRGIFFALSCLSILGVMPVISNSRPDGFDALGFAFFLSAWQTLFAIPLFAVERRSANPGVFANEVSVGTRKRAARITIFTGAIFGLATYLYVFSIEKAGAVNAAIAIQAYPLFAIGIETIFLNRRKTRLELALTLALIGALYFLGTEGEGRLEGVSVYFLVALAVPLLWSIAHIIIKEELERTPITPAQITFVRVAVSAVFLGAGTAVLAPASLVTALARADFQLFAAVMGLVYYLELILWFHAVRHIDVSLASSITTPWPALTMALAAIFLGDSIETYQVIAFAVVALCIYGLMVAGLRNARPKPA